MLSQSRYRLILIGLAAILAVPAAIAAPMSDAQVRTAIIQDSLSSYPGNCPCPYNRDRAGRSAAAGVPTAGRAAIRLSAIPTT